MNSGNELNLDVVGFYFLDLATNYTPPQDLAAFLAAGEAPVYIGLAKISYVVCCNLTFIRF